MKVKTKRFLAIVLIILILCNLLPTNVFAKFITEVNSNVEFGVIEGSMDDYWQEMHYAKYDGQTYLVFCVERKVDSATGREYAYNDEFIAQYKENRSEYEKIAEMIYFGYTMNFGTGLPTTIEAKRAMCCTQQYVWDYIHENIDSSYPTAIKTHWDSKYMSEKLYAEWLEKTEAYYNRYHSNVSFNGTTQNIVAGETITITDENGVLANYDNFNKAVNGVNFTHEKNSNELKISVANNCTAENVKFNSKKHGIYELMPNGTAYSEATMGNFVYFKFHDGNVQNVMFSNYVDPSTFNISVNVDYGNMMVRKTNKNGDIVAGCTFELYEDLNCTQKVRTGTSDNNGQIHFEKLTPGIYYIKEVAVPTGYLLDTAVKEVRINVNETAEISFENNEPTGNLKLTKTDEEIGNENRADGMFHHGDATLEGTEYTLYAKEDIYNVAKTVKYFSASEEIATFTFNSNGIATINITTKSASINLTTNGEFLKGLPMGNYYAKETKVPTGYLQDTEVHNIALKYKDMNTKIVNLEDTFTNHVEKAKFEIIKISSITNTTAPVIANAEFTAILTKYVDFYGGFYEALKHIDEFSEDEYSIFRTDDKGHGISGLLAHGKYTVYETYCPSDFLNPVRPFEVVIDENSQDVIKELVENDTPFQSYIKMIKKDKKTGKTVTFSNTTFSLYKLNEENNEWERISCKLGRESFNSWTTDKEGIAYTETKLIAGTYKINEIKIPESFLQLDEEIVFKVNGSNKTLEYDSDYDAYITVEVENEQPTGTLIVDKSVAIREEVDTSLVDYSDLSGIEFTLMAKENILDMADGSTIYEKGQIVKIFNVDKEGNYTLIDLPIGVYELVETKTLNGLVLNDKKYEVKFEQKDLIQKVYEETKEISNDTTIFEFSKKDITGDNELEGATLTVLDKDNNIIDTWVSGEKTHKIEGLKVGETYILRENITPDEYVQATDIEFTVENTNEIQKVEMIDKRVAIKKTDLLTGEIIEGAELVLTDKEGNVIDEWVSGKEEHYITGLIEGKKYILTEKTCPYGYEIAENIEFTVTKDKDTQIIEMKDMPILTEVILVKIDSKTKDIIKANFTFGIYRDENCTDLIQKVKSNSEQGTITFKERYGTFFVKEVKAPNGFIKSDKIIRLEINDTGVFIDGIQIEQNNNIYSFEFENAPIETPNTRRY